MRFANGMKTAFLLGLMGALILVVGYWLGGTTGLVIAFVIAMGMNGFSYWNSGKLALRAMHARPVTEAEQPMMYRIVRDLAMQQGQPMPTLHVSPTDGPERLCDRTQPAERRGVLHRGHLCSCLTSANYAACSPTSWATSTTATF